MDEPAMKDAGANERRHDREEKKSRKESVPRVVSLEAKTQAGDSARAGVGSRHEIPVSGLWDVQSMQQSTIRQPTTHQNKTS
jgi:hypothetical protein